ncbi:MAG: prephenate dehydrogenase [Planctomycetia bacterium]|nr:prephenate dehydrogenase [Planctomycetia bacterium]
MEKIFSNLIISGVGLLGGSVGLAVRKYHLVENIRGLFRSAPRAQAALDLGAVDEAVSSWKEALSFPSDSNSSAPERSVLIVIAVPVAMIREQIEQILQTLEEIGDPRTKYYITDVGSTKEQLIRELDRTVFPENAVYVGSHPIAGSEKTGVENASAELFEEKTAVITPIQKECDSPKEEEALHRIGHFWSSLGSWVVFLSAAEHDRILAKTSHLPHLLSVSLTNTLEKCDFPFAGTGFLGMSRLAASSSEIWSDIFMANRKSLIESIIRLENILDCWKSVLNDQDRNKIITLLEEAKKKRDALGS